MGFADKYLKNIETDKNITNSGNFISSPKAALAGYIAFSTSASEELIIEQMYKPIYRQLNEVLNQLESSGLIVNSLVKPLLDQLLIQSLSIYKTLEHKSLIVFTSFYWTDISDDDTKYKYIPMFTVNTCYADEKYLTDGSGTMDMDNMSTIYITNIPLTQGNMLYDFGDGISPSHFNGEEDD